MFTDDSGKEYLMSMAKDNKRSDLASCWLIGISLKGGKFQMIHTLNILYSFKTYKCIFIFSSLMVSQHASFLK